MKKLLLALGALATAAPAIALPEGAGFLSTYYLSRGECQQAAATHRRESSTQNGDWFFVCLYDEQSDSWRMWPTRGSITSADRYGAGLAGRFVAPAPD